MRHTKTLLAGCLAADVVLSAAWPNTARPIEPTPVVEEPGVYRPRLKVPESVEPFLKQIEPGNDAFPEERTARELQLRLAELGARLKRSPAEAAGIADWLLAPDFRGAALRPLEERAAGSDPALEIQRASRSATERTLDAHAFARELQALVAEFRAVGVAEFLITSIESQPAESLATTEVRYDLVGPGRQAWRVEALGSWRIRWRREQGAWRATEWSASGQLRSRAPAPVFAEVTPAALGGNESFRRQLSTDFDSWVATIDSVLARDSNGHHGVSVGDADGDGQDDLYVAQPGGLPNRLYRARGDSTFEDVTERAGLGVLDDTAASLFADVDNDGDEDLVLVTAAQPLLFLNDGHGRFTRVPDAFRFERPLAGSLMSMAMADYDRDGFLDLYLCVYSYSYGAGEDKLGTPMPYHDARSGPPAVLFRNDGHGHFVETTREAGLDAGNDRYHFAAAWGDYDGDGWPDLLVANDFGTKNLYHNLGQARRQGDVRGRRGEGGRARLRRRHERGLPRLRQRRAPRHLHRQHVERQRPARHRAARLHEGRLRRGARALPPPRARQLALPQHRRRPLRGRDASGARGLRPLGLVVGRPRLRRRRLRGPLHRERHADARARRTRTWTASSGARWSRARRRRA